jgi:glyoxylase-like metal-dependent hydrolase (beta-lactamase superfamily II)
MVETVFSFWLLRGSRERVLVDCGFSADSSARFMPDVIQRLDQDPVTHLRRSGIEPETITAVILTHAHFDHLSDTISRFTNARVFLQRDEYAFVTDPPHPWFSRMTDMDTLRALAAEGAPRFNLIDGRREVLPGIWVIPTPGHTQGHQSVIVDTGSARSCITGDAAFLRRNIDEDIGPGFNSNLIDALRSLGELRKLQDEGVVMLCSHDPDCVRTAMPVSVL